MNLIRRSSLLYFLALVTQPIHFLAAFTDVLDVFSLASFFTLHGLYAVPCNSLRRPIGNSRYFDSVNFTILSSRIDSYKYSFFPRNKWSFPIGLTTAGCSIQFQTIRLSSHSALLKLPAPMENNSSDGSSCIPFSAPSVFHEYFFCWKLRYLQEWTSWGLVWLLLEDFQWKLHNTYRYRHSGQTCMQHCFNSDNREIWNQTGNEWYKIFPEIQNNVQKLITMPILRKLIGL